MAKAIYYCLNCDWPMSGDDKNVKNCCLDCNTVEKRKKMEEEQKK